MKRNLKFGLAGAKREHESISVLVSLGDWKKFHGLAPRRCGHTLINDGAIREKKLKVATVHQGAGRVGSVVHGKQAGAAQFTALGLQAHHVCSDSDPFDFRGDIEYLNCDRIGPGWGHAMVSHAMVDGANQVRAGVRQREREVTAGINSGMRYLFHPLPHADQCYTISRGRLAGGAVGDLTSEGLREDGSGKGKRNAESNNNNNDGNRPGRYDSRGVVLQLPRSVSVQIFGLTRSNAVSSFLPRVNPAWALPLSLSE